MIYLALCSIAVANIDNSKSNVIIFIRNLLRVFSPPIIIEVLSSPVQKKRTFAKAVLYVPSILFNNTPSFMTSVLEKVFKNQTISLLSL